MEIIKKAGLSWITSANMRTIRAAFVMVLVSSMASLLPAVASAGMVRIATAVEKEKIPAEKLQNLRNFLFPSVEKRAMSALKNGSKDWDEDLDDGFGVKTDAIVVVHQGRIIYEEYHNGYTVDMPHRLWSVGKSVTSSLVGMAIQEGKIGINDSICQYLTPPANRNVEQHCAITIKNLLHWSSSLEWQESYGSNLNPRRSSVLAMLYGQGQPDMASFVFDHAMEAEAGKVFNYSTGETNLLWAILRRVYGEEEYTRLPWTKLFDPLEMQNVTVERDPTGLFSGGSHIYMRPRDLAAYAQFFLQDGTIKGTKLLPGNWREFSTTMAPSVAGRGGSDPRGKNIPGAHWWVNQGIPERDIAQPWPDAPADTFAGIGVFGQTVMISPSKELIVVRMGQDLAGGFEHNELMKLALGLIQ